MKEWIMIALLGLIVVSSFGSVGPSKARKRIAERVCVMHGGVELIDSEWLGMTHRVFCSDGRAFPLP